MTLVASPTQLASRALDWICENLHQFKPVGRNGELDELRKQALAEALMLSLYMRRNSFFLNDCRLDRISQFVLAAYHDAVFTDQLFRFDFIAHATFVVFLEAAGLRVDEFDRNVVRERCDSREICEYAPHRLINLRYVLDLGRIKHCLPTYAQLCSGGFLTFKLNLCDITNSDVYRITHLLFYCADFGARELEGLSSSDKSYGVWVVDKLLAMHISRRDWDLVSELMLSSKCLRSDQANLSSGWRALIAAQNQSGMFPGPYFRQGKADELSGDDRAKYLFETCYHTTIVAALAGALCS
jgi:hypothetical protein